jgi:hypothetical protein
MHPNGFNQLYPVKEQEEEMDEDFEQKEYFADFDQFAKSAGFEESTDASKPPIEDDEEIETPLAIRPEGVCVFLPLPPSPLFLPPPLLLLLLLPNILSSLQCLKFNFI